jgi:DNA invertase Pin-like site-specific DNA recombinase
VWALDRITREGAEGALRIIRMFRERGCVLVSVGGLAEHLPRGPGRPGGLRRLGMAQQESQRRSERIRAGLERRRRQGLPVGRQPGAKDRTPRKRSGYVARWERERSA